MPQAASQDLSGCGPGISIFLNFQITTKVENHLSMLIIVISPFQECFRNKHVT